LPLNNLYDEFSKKTLIKYIGQKHSVEVLTLSLNVMIKVKNLLFLLNLRNQKPLK